MKPFVNIVEARLWASQLFLQTGIGAPKSVLVWVPIGVKRVTFMTGITAFGEVTHSYLEGNGYVPWRP